MAVKFIIIRKRLNHRDSAFLLWKYVDGDISVARAITIYPRPLYPPLYPCMAGFSPRRRVVYRAG